MIMFILMGTIIIAQLFNLQILNTKYSLIADEQGRFRKVVYPDRGILFDRKGKAILRNTIIYDLMVTPGKIRGMNLDTAAICRILEIDTAEFKKRILTAII
ncbi:MAG: penicillin-binding protein 2, partial [Ginsengibacter sp.]